MDLEFRPISLSDQTVFNQYLSQCPQKTSDYSFVNVWSWAAAYDLVWVQTDEFIWLRQNHPTLQYWAPIGNWQAVDWSRYFDRFPQFKSSMIRVPEQLARLWETIFKELVSAFPDRDQFDYIYDADELITLKGNRFHKKRNLLHQFQKKSDYQYVEMSSAFMDAAMAMQNSWCTWRECDSDIQLANENMAIAKVLSHWEELEGIVGGCILVQGAMVAYTIGEWLGDDSLVVHFEKGDTQYKGVYQAVNQMFVEHETSGLKKSIKRVNREQDLGDAGLRRSKESYHPVEFLKKFRVDWTPAENMFR
ncbi:MAG: phosphatidylglycerol lysyltransferase domain-containing protein [Desulfobacteraceae bacterium]|jgi:hypothetical protein|nr:phosphatidylglycerol lysyltransferase domain-containing protein [Desulfobacteraceae bacterium]